MEKKDIKSLNLSEVTEELTSLGEKKFRAAQMYDWMHVKLARSLDEMTNLPVSLREKLKEEYEFTSLSVEDVQTSAIDGTKKFLFGLKDG
ncbi:MAG: 23S rRNA (adenine(2503)-C(2))-methyltransferase RlmN, partial [Lachnospiraceae bacterium]|nr:23S rRNA (adenine(2503)-C(2))-methyltransferase RlmN [Lachnospiraceae bacterium]